MMLKNVAEWILDALITSNVLSTSGNSTTIGMKEALSWSELVASMVEACATHAALLSLAREYMASLSPALPRLIQFHASHVVHFAVFWKIICCHWLELKVLGHVVDLATDTALPPKVHKPCLDVQFSLSYCECLAELGFCVGENSVTVLFDSQETAAAIYALVENVLIALPLLLQKETNSCMHFLIVSKISVLVSDGLCLCQMGYA